MAAKNGNFQSPQIDPLDSINSVDLVSLKFRQSLVNNNSVINARCTL